MASIPSFTQAQAPGALRQPRPRLTETVLQQCGRQGVADVYPAPAVPAQRHRLQFRCVGARRFFFSLGACGVHASSLFFLPRLVTATDRNT